MKKDISIVIPTLNEEKYLPKTLESILSQKTEYSYEIIIADNYSEDATRDIAKQYGCKVLLVRKKSIPYTRRIGTINTHSEVIINSSADTEYSDGWLQRLAEPLFKDSVGTIGPIYPKQGTIIENIGAKLLDITAYTLNKIGYYYASADNLAFRRREFKKIGGFKKDLVTGEEIDVLKKLSKYGKIEYISDARVYVSMRRLRKWGIIKYLYFHTKNYIRSHLGKQPLTKYEPIR